MAKQTRLGLTYPPKPSGYWQDPDPVLIERPDQFWKGFTAGWVGGVIIGALAVVVIVALRTHMNI
jgi:hypothetical protein